MTSFSAMASVRYSVLVMALFLLAACGHLPIQGPASARLSVRLLSGLDNADIIAADRAGTKVAFSDNGLTVMDIGSGQRRRFAEDSPVAVGWSADGEFMAAAFPAQKSSRVIIYDKQGLSTAERDLPGMVSAIFWTADRELSAVSVELSHYKFGISYRQSLYRWLPGAEPAGSVLHETTLMPMFQQKYGLEQLYGIIRPLLSPLGDELLYAKLVNPPLFEPYQKLVVRNLTAPAEREIASVGLAASRVMFSADSEEIIYADKDNKVVRRSIWDGDVLEKTVMSGGYLTGSASGHYQLADGSLYRDGSQVATLPAKSRSLFLPAGRLLVAWDKSLYLVQGLEPEEVVSGFTPQQFEKLVAMRAWRAGGLITPAEYSESRKKILQK